MSAAQRKIFYDYEDWASAWNGVTPSRGLRWKRRRPSGDPLAHVAHFLGGATLSHRFRLFNHGDLFTLERRRGQFVQEILIRTAKADPNTGLIPLRVQLHLSHTGLRDIRERYWRPSNRVPVAVAAGDLGGLEIPPCRVIWYLGSEMDTLEDVAGWVTRLAIPWFESFENPTRLLFSLYDRSITWVDHPVALELLLADYGRLEAGRYFRECVLGDERYGAQCLEELTRLGEWQRPPLDTSSPAYHVALAAKSYDLV